MTDDDTPLPSDTEHGGLKPKDEKGAEPPPPDDKEVEREPSKQPS